MTAHSSTPRGSDKRERILEAAEVVFAEHGFARARVSEIARAAGVADGTIYLYFKSKDDLLIELFDSRMQRVTAALRTATDGVADASLRLRSFVSAYLSLVRENPPLAEVLTVELRQSSKFMKEPGRPQFAELLKLLGAIVADGHESGQFDAAIPAPIAARAIFGMIDELALAWLLGGKEKFDIVRAADWVGALVLRGLERRNS